jgi:hypothetical protein
LTGELFLGINLAIFRECSMRAEQSSSIFCPFSKPLSSPPPVDVIRRADVPSSGMF